MQNKYICPKLLSLEWELDVKVLVSAWIDDQKIKKRTSLLKIYKDESLECGLNSTEVWMMKEYMQALEG